MAADGIVAERLTAQLLAGRPARDPLAVAERLLAIQAQDARGARLAVRARTEGVTAADVDRALTEDRSLVITWVNRGTLHLVRSEDLAWLSELTLPPLKTANARRLAEEGVSPDAADRGVRAVERLLAEEGPQTRAQIRACLDAAGVPTAGQALVHVMLLATLRGLVLRGPMVGGDQAFALVRDWLGEPPRVDRDVALAELARRYLAGHGPASDRDLARWAGIALGDARRGLGAIAGELREREDGLVDLAKRSRAATLPPPRLLGAFEPLLLGWVSREELLGEYTDRVVVGGIFRPVALAGGRAVATWRIVGRRVEIVPFAPLDPADAAALDADGAAVLEFLGRG